MTNTRNSKSRRDVVELSPPIHSTPKNPPLLSRLEFLKTQRDTTLVDILNYHAAYCSDRLAYTYIPPRKRHIVEWTYGMLAERAQSAAQFFSTTLTRGDRVALLLPSGLEYVGTFFGCLLAGMVAVPLFPPVAKDRSGRLEKIIADADCALVLVPETMLESAHIATTVRGARVEAAETVLSGQASQIDPRYVPSTKDLAFLQYSSGSTGDPKGVMVNHGNLISNARSIEHAAALSDADRMVSWLPLYHDMGLIGNVLQALYSGIHSILLQPLHFIQNPEVWLKTISQFRATISGGPNFAYQLCVDRVLAERTDALDLSCWRIAFCGAEPVRQSTLISFANRFARAQFREDALLPCYGLAEATLFVSGSKQIGSSLNILGLDRSALEGGRFLPLKNGELNAVSCGGLAIDHQVEICNTKLEPQPGGIVGEILVAGPNIAQGYWNRPDSSAEIFCRSVKGKTGEFMRTGDLGVEWGGELFIMGRIKDLIIINGRNIYPQDIESASEAANPCCRKGGAAAFQCPHSGGLILWQEISRKSVNTVDLTPVAQNVKAVVMRTTQVEIDELVFVLPNAVPKTSSGKVRRSAVSDLHSKGLTPRIVQPDQPKSFVPVEKLRVLVAESLGLRTEDVPIEHSLAALGVPSLTVMRLHSTLIDSFGSAPDIARMLDPEVSLSVLSNELESPATKPATPNVDPSRTSMGQQQLWFSDQITLGAEQNLTLGLRFNSVLDRAQVTRWLTRIMALHPELRSRYVDGGKGLVRTIETESDLILTEHALTANPKAQEAVLRKESARPFNLTSEPPFRAALFMAANETILQLTAHHIAIDMWSWEVLLEDLERIVSGLELIPEDLSYDQFVAAQNGVDMEAARIHWQSELSGLPNNQVLPTSRDSMALRFNFDIAPSIGQHLEDFACARKVSVYAIMLSAFQMTLAEWSNQSDFAVGVPLAGRPTRGFDRTVGYFVNTVPIRAISPINKTPFEHVVRTSKQLRSAIEHQAVSFAAVARDLSLPRVGSGMAPFQATFVLQQVRDGSRAASFALGDPQTKLHLGKLVMSTVNVIPPAIGFDLMAYVTSRPEGGYYCAFDHRVDSLSLEEAPSLSTLFIAMLERIISTPDSPFSSRQHQTVGPLYTVDSSDSLSRRFATQVKVRPAATALRVKAQPISYAELNDRANQLANHALKQCGRRPVRIAIALERSVDLIAAMIASVKLGAAYVPIDPAAPLRRSELILNQCDPDAIFGTLTHDGAVTIDTKVATIGQEDLEEPKIKVASDSVAYVIFTSGSTGTPKGVEVTHFNVCSLLSGASNRFDFGTDDVWTLFHSSAFDFSVWEIWGSLLTGGCIVVPDLETVRDPQAFVDFCSVEGVTVLNQTPTAFRSFIAAEKESTPPLALRYVIFGGEALPFHILKPWVSRHGDIKPQLINMYGITETTVHVSFRRILINDLMDQKSLIGEALPHLEIFVLDESLQPTSPGNRGQIYVSGAGLALGYLGRPDLTDERFINLDLAGRGLVRLYCTGDFGVPTKDGDIEYAGRDDNQIKIRGHRIELGEIELVLSQCEGVSDAIVLLDAVTTPQTMVRYENQRHVRKENGVEVTDQRRLLREDFCLALEQMDRGEERELVAYIVPSKDATFDLAVMATELRDRLPEYMCPQRVVFLDQFPRTINGKLDIANLPCAATDGRQFLSEKVIVATPTEAKIITAFESVLRTGAIGATDRFFDAGGDSIKAIQLRASLLRQGFDVSLAQIFEAQTPRALASCGTVSEVERRGRRKSFDLVNNEDRALVPGSVENMFPLTQVQAGLVFHSQLGQTLYCDTLSFWIEMPYEPEFFCVALDRLVTRHEILRTSFDFGTYSEPMQLVHERAQIPLEAIDWRHLSREDQHTQYDSWLAHEKAKGYDWTSPPLIRFCLQRLTNDLLILNLSFHDSIIDGWSEMSLLTELLSTYMAQIRSEDLGSIQYLDSGFDDYVALEREALADLDSMNFWLSHLEGARPSLVARWHDEELDVNDGEMGYLSVDISGEISEGLNRVAALAGVPLKHVMLAAHCRAVSLLSGETDVIVAVENNGRVEEGDGDKVLGTHLNVIPMRIKLGRGSWVDFVKDVYQVEQKCQPHRRVPYQEVMRRMGGKRLFDTNFNFTHFHVLEALQLIDGITFVDARAFIHTDFALRAEYNIDPFTKRLVLDIEANVRDFPTAQIKMIGDVFRSVLTSIATEPEAICAQIDPLAEIDDSMRSVAHGADKAWPDTDFLSGFVRQVKATPEAKAISCASESITYTELMARANGIAAHLVHIGIVKGDFVGLFMERGIDHIAAIIGVMWCGAVWCPLHKTPEGRVRHMLDLAAPRAIMTDKVHEATLAALVDFSSCTLVLVEQCANMTSLNPAPVPIAPRDPAYVLFTSGSTGEPKGALIHHLGMLNHLLGMAEELDLCRDDVICQDAADTFDIFVWQCLTPLLIGASVEVIPSSVTAEPILLLSALDATGVTVVEATPSVLGVQLSAVELKGADAPHLKTVRWVLASGETLKPDLARRWMTRFPGKRFANLWGVTEASDDCSIEELSAPLPPGVLRVSIGRPFPNVDLYVLDAYGHPLPVGVPGELCVAGICVGLGYVNTPERTQEVFVDQANVADGRLYRTGDIATMTPERKLIFHGRRDFQVKIRGNRIELGEIEARITDLTQVGDAVVLARKDKRGDLRIDAYITATVGMSIASDDIITALSRTLPKPMIPATLTILKDLPRTLNGKLDRSALPEPRQAKESFFDAVFVTPETYMEMDICTIFSRLLKVESISATTSFFEAGGHSLLATQAASQLSVKLNHFVSLKLLFENPDARSLSTALDSVLSPLAQSKIWDPIVRLQEGDPAEPAIVMLHAVGGSVLIYDSFIKALNTNRVIYGIQAPESTDLIPETLRDMSDTYAAAIIAASQTSRLVLVGWSMGGLLAQDLAAGPLAEITENLVMIDSFLPNSGRFHTPLVLDAFYTLARSLGIIDGLPTEYFSDDENELFELVMARGIEKGILTPRCRGWVRARYNIITKNLHAVCHHDPRPSTSRTLLLMAKDAGGSDRCTDAASWSSYADNLELLYLSGDHFTIMEPPDVHKVAQTVCRFLTDVQP